MSAIIRPAGALKSYIAGENEIEVDSGQTLKQALGILGIPSEIVALVIVNEEQQPKDYLLQEGDVVKLIAVIGGG
ncbi:MAG: MoaD/ThiS family protein [Anaerolineales bacterium]|nr:MoaD/ThiS family protein [Anaerolineales bacterium]MDD5466983.1 MoaD/ThiS family protein [Anaerolineales bacterium]